MLVRTIESCDSRVRSKMRKIERRPRRKAGEGLVYPAKVLLAALKLLTIEVVIEGCELVRLWEVSPDR